MDNLQQLGMLFEVKRCAFLTVVSFLFVTSAVRAQPEPAISSPYSHWQNGPSRDEHYFPIAVWLQDPKRAAEYKAAGINLYVGLWRGPTTEQLGQLKAAGMSVICGQNRVALEHKDDATIVGWMHGDEPDNAQSLGQGKGYGPPIGPEKIVRDYERIRAADPTRPVLLNLGQGVAWDNYIGRGVRRNHPEDYPEYLRGCDMASFDIYPVVHDSPAIAGKLEFVAHGVERLRRWTADQKVVWNCIECTHISNPETKASPAQVRSEVWMSLIHGSQGIIYFVHQFKPTFIEAGLLADAKILEGVTAINRQIHELAPALNSATLTDEVTARQVSAPDSQSAADGGSVAILHKRYSGTNYLFTVNMRPEAISATFRWSKSPGKALKVLDERREVLVENGSFTDAYTPYQVHLYTSY